MTLTRKYTHVTVTVFTEYRVVLVSTTEFSSQMSVYSIHTPTRLYSVDSLNISKVSTLLLFEK